MQPAARHWDDDRAQDHREAISLLEDVDPGGREAAKSLARLLSLKDEAQYGMSGVGGQTLRSAIRQARILIDLAETVLRR
jgi:hypothetical protein